jgi:Ca-activated chloride channel family protein
VNEVEEKMTALFAKLEAPVLTNLAIETSANAEVWPEKLPDLYAGEPLIVTLRTPVAATKSLGRVVATSWNANLDAPADSAQSGIAKLWARQKIDAVRDRVFTGGNELEVKAEIVKLAIDHHLVTEHTSLVAVDNTPTGIDAQSCKPELVPLEMPAGWGGGESAALPQSGTASTLAMLIGMALLLGAIVMRRL